jgi:hypothetical protein
VSSSKDIVANQQEEIVKLSQIISDADKERCRQRNEVSSVLAERNLLTSQLVKRSSESQAVYANIRAQRNNLRMGERQYDTLMREIYKWQRKLIQVNLSSLDHCHILLCTYLTFCISLVGGEG